MKLTEAVLKKLILEVLEDDNDEMDDEEVGQPEVIPSEEPVAPPPPQRKKIRWSPFIPQDVRKFGSSPLDPRMIYRSDKPTNKVRKDFVRFPFSVGNMELDSMKAQQDKTIDRYRRRSKVKTIDYKEYLMIYSTYQPYEQVTDYRDAKKGDYGERKVTMRIPDWAYRLNDEDGYIDIKKSFLLRQKIKLIDEDGNFIDNMGRVFLTYNQHKKLANATKYVPYTGKKKPQTKKVDDSGNPI